MVAVIKAFTNKDELKTLEQIEAFLNQFQLNDQTMTEIEREFAIHGRDALKSYKFNTDDIAEFEKKFELEGREAFKRRCKFTEKELKQIEKDISKIPKTGKKSFEAKYKFLQEDVKEIEVSFKTNGLTRESLVHRFKLSEGELKELEENFAGFGREALMQKYKLRDSDMIELRKTIENFKQYTVPIQDTSSVIVAVMSHGDNGKVYGNILKQFQNEQCNFV